MNAINILFYRAFDLENTTGCTSDYAEIRDGRDLSVSIGRYCGQTIPPETSVNQSMHIMFRSDGENQQSGFHAKFNTCKSFYLYI